MWQSLKQQLIDGDVKSLARAISLVENQVAGYEDFLASLPVSSTPVIGITGAPGSGKSTLTDALIALLVGQEKRVAVICVDPSSAFNLGALLGDRIRMSRWYTDPKVFIRSLASRGSLGGLNPRIIEIADIVKFAGFDYVLIETVGVGQTEIEIAGLADVTVVLTVPEGGDEIQVMKAGLMEIADIFVVNKADRPGADAFISNLRMMLAPAFTNHKYEVPVLKTIASNNEGIPELFTSIQNTLKQVGNSERKDWLLAEKAYQLIQHKRMKGVDRSDLKRIISDAKGNLNLYELVKNF